jgi:hypothetical protein
MVGKPASMFTLFTLARRRRFTKWRKFQERRTSCADYGSRDVHCIIQHGGREYALPYVRWPSACISPHSQRGPWMNTAIG